MEKLVDFNPEGLKAYKALEEIIGTGRARMKWESIVIGEISNRLQRGVLSPGEAFEGILKIVTRTGLLMEQ